MGVDIVRSSRASGRRKSEAGAWLWTGAIVLAGVAITCLSIVNGAPFLLTLVGGGALTACFLTYSVITIVMNRGARRTHSTSERDDGRRSDPGDDREPDPRS